jgi:hypothetical protein
MLSENLWLIVFVLVVLRLVLLSGRLWLVPASHEELVKDFEKLLYLVHALKELFFLLNLLLAFALGFSIFID